MWDSPTWDSVLTEVEEDVRRTELLLTAAAAPPHLSDDGPCLPDLATMPSVPPELIGRVHALRERIAEVRKELELALELAGPRPAAPRRLAPVAVETPSRFLDRSV